MPPIRALIVDDEPLARERIRTLLSSEKDFSVAGECKNGTEALHMLNQSGIDVVFLDVQMPKMNGFDMLQMLSPEKIPVIVFTTAYDAFALKAFEVNATDYLLKPFDRKRFGDALKKIREQIKVRDPDLLTAQLMESVKSITEKKIFVERIVVKEQGRILYLPVKEIQWIESEANYLSLYSGQGTFTLRETLTNIEKKLDPEIFRRIHRSVIVRLTEIREVKQWLNEDYIIILKNGTQLSVGRSYKKEVLKRLRSGDI